MEERSSPEFSMRKKVQVGRRGLEGVKGCCLFIYTKPAVLNGGVTSCVLEEGTREKRFTLYSNLCRSEKKFFLFIRLTCCVLAYKS